MTSMINLLNVFSRFLPRPGSACVQFDGHKAVASRYLPAMKKWVDDQVSWGWKKSIEDRCKQHPALQGKQDDILPALERELSVLKQRYSHLDTDSRSHTNVLVACMTLATHKVLLPYVRNEPELLQMLLEQNGKKSEEGIR